MLVHNEKCYYRGSDRGEGNKRILEPKDNDISYTKKGYVSQKGGVSVNTDPNHPTVLKFHHTYEFTESNLPAGLKIKPNGTKANPGHCLIVPADGYNLTYDDYVNLLKLISTIKRR